MAFGAPVAGVSTFRKWQFLWGGLDEQSVNIEWQMTPILAGEKENKLVTPEVSWWKPCENTMVSYPQKSTHPDLELEVEVVPTSTYVC